jgi:hypothetical protein
MVLGTEVSAEGRKQKADGSDGDFMNSNVKKLAHVAQPPLSIERDYTMEGREVIIIEGVRYDADYFRTFAHPDTDVLYTVWRDEDVVVLTLIQTPEEAIEFFDPHPALPQSGEEHPDLGEGEFEGDNDGL